MAALDHENGTGSCKNLKVHVELAEDENVRPIPEDPPVIHRQLSSSSNLSDSSLESVVLENNENGMDTSESKHAGNDFNFPSPVWSFQGGSATQSSSTQMMARPPGYDPNRIPLSIFSCKATNSNPMAWSHATNESLFSVQFGNNSFSRDHFSYCNESVELPRPDKSTTKSVEEEVPSNCADVERQSESTLILPTDTSEEIADTVMVKQCEPIDTLAESTTVVSHETPEDNSKKAMAPNEEANNAPIVLHRSDESMMSTKSFQFPL